MHARLWTKINGSWGDFDSTFTGRLQKTLVGPANLVYQGFFTVPSDIHSGGAADAGFEYGGTAIAFNPARGSLYMVGHDWDQFVAEISIPPLGSRASLLQPLTDAFEGIRGVVGDGSAVKVGGLLPLADQLVMSAYTYDDGLGTQICPISRGPST